MSTQPHEHPGWAPFLQPGTRVVLRYRIDPASAPGGEHFSDALGTISAAGDDQLAVITRRGEVQVPRSAVVASKPVPPPPPARRQAQH